MRTLSIVGLISVVWVVAAAVSVFRQDIRLPKTDLIQFSSQESVGNPTPPSSEKISIVAAPDTKPSDQPSVQRHVNPFAFPLTGGKIATDKYWYELVYEELDDGTMKGSADRLEFISPSGDRVIIPGDIWSQIAGSSNHGKGWNPRVDLASHYMPIHPKDNNTVFLSNTYRVDEENSKIVNRIFSYNIKTSDLKEVYYEVSENDSPRNNGTPRVLRTMGMDGSKLIVLYSDIDDSPGPCFGYWSSYNDRMGFLELSDVQSGLKPYVVPTYKIKEDKKFVEECVKDFYR